MLIHKWFKNIKPNTEFVAKNIMYYKTVDSTNIVARNTQCADGTLFIAEKQTAGKGRMGRIWVSQKGCGICMSMALMPDMNPADINVITLVTGLAVCETLNTIYKLPFKIKWPNDVVVGGKKICGILTECKTENGKITKVITGIGINVNQKKFPLEIGDIATSIYILTGKKSNRETIINTFAKIFEDYYVLLLNGDTNGIIERYKKLCVNIDMDIVAIKNNEKIHGKAIDVSKTGELIIKKEDGTLLNINSGEVTVHKYD